MKITPPTIHLNGTSKRNLVAEYTQAYDLCCDAIEAFQKITCHPRDYYVQEAGAYEKAHDDRMKMLAKLAAVNDYLLQHLAHLDND